MATNFMILGKKEWQRINQILRERNIKPGQMKFINHCRPHGKSESIEHWMSKALKCKELYDLNHPYLTEVWTEDGIKYDILDLATNEDIEIVISENREATKSYKADIMIKPKGG